MELVYKEHMQIARVESDSSNAISKILNAMLQTRNGIVLFWTFYFMVLLIMFYILITSQELLMNLLIE